jgi:hypothetical protein
MHGDINRDRIRRYDRKFIEDSTYPGGFREVEREYVAGRGHGLHDDHRGDYR